MGRFIGLSKNRGSGLAIEDPDFLNSGLILTSNGTGFVLAGGASLDRDPLPDFVNANETLNESLSVTGAFADSTYTFAWRDGAQYGLSLSSSGTLSGSAASMPAATTLSITVTDTKYIKQYDVDLQLIVSTSSSFPAITTNNGSITLQGSETYQFTYTGTPTEWSIVTRGNLPANVTISGSGLMTWPGKGSDNTTTTYNFTLGVRNGDMPAGEFRTVAFSKSFYFESITGQQQYEGAYGQAGGQCSYNWIAPSGVTQVNVMAIGGGGGGRYSWASCGGHGGGMVWANNIPVSPGSSYCVQVGRGGCWSGSTGGCSCWPGMNACGGCCGCYGGCFGFPGSVNGGSGSCCGGYGMAAYNNTAGGGGGGPGYCSSAPANSVTSSHKGCGGGAGSATSHHSSTYGTGGGGGTGSCGMCCYTTSPVSCGCCGNAGYSHQTGSGGQGGSGGGCGRPGEPWSNGRGHGYSCGGQFGGGGGGGGTSHGGGWGGPGVVRIIWGNNRCWPCCNTHNL
jgi:hypothetical protein